MNKEETQEELNCFTGQPFVDRFKETVACPECGCEIGLRSNAWFDRYSTHKPEGSKGIYVCKAHLSETRKEHILKERPREYFDSATAPSHLNAPII